MEGAFRIQLRQRHRGVLSNAEELGVTEGYFMWVKLMGSKVGREGMKEEASIFQESVT